MKKAILLASVLMVNSWSGLVQAQVQVVEAGIGQTQPSGAVAPAPAGNDLLISLYNQLEALQQEAQTLRGMVEEQSNRLRRLEAETRDRYLDMDNRLSTLSAGAGSVPGMPGSQAPGAVVVPGASSGMPVGDVSSRGPFNPVVQGATSNPLPAPLRPGAPAETLPDAGTDAAVDTAASQLSEPDLYRSALNLLLEEGKSVESVAMFQAYLQRFPQGRLLPNALYWQGEALILLARYPEARAAFDRVLNEFPSDAKAAGAMLKIGVVQNLQGNRSEAERTWQELPLRFPDSASEITLARDYLSRP